MELFSLSSPYFLVSPSPFLRFDLWLVDSRVGGPSDYYLVLPSEGGLLGSLEGEELEDFLGLVEGLGGDFPLYLSPSV